LLCWHEQQNTTEVSQLLVIICKGVSQKSIPEIYCDWPLKRILKLLHDSIKSHVFTRLVVDAADNISGIDCLQENERVLQMVGKCKYMLSKLTVTRRPLRPVWLRATLEIKNEI
jgi:hypothetical protein